jgi:hypothetical protein
MSRILLNQNKSGQKVAEVTKFLTTRRDYGKGKAIPLQAWRGPEYSRRMRLPDFKTIGA